LHKRAGGNKPEQKAGARSWSKELEQNSWIGVWSEELEQGAGLK